MHFNVLILLNLDNLKLDGTPTNGTILHNISIRMILLTIRRSHGNNGRVINVNKTEQDLKIVLSQRTQNIRRLSTLNNTIIRIRVYRTGTAGTLIRRSQHSTTARPNTRITVNHVLNFTTKGLQGRFTRAKRRRTGTIILHNSLRTATHRVRGQLIATAIARFGLFRLNTTNRTSRLIARTGAGSQRLTSRLLRLLMNLRRNVKITKTIKRGSTVEVRIRRLLNKHVPQRSNRITTNASRTLRGATLRATIMNSRFIANEDNDHGHGTVHNERINNRGLIEHKATRNLSRILTRRHKHYIRALNRLISIRSLYQSGTRLKAVITRVTRRDTNISALSDSSTIDTRMLQRTSNQTPIEEHNTRITGSRTTRDQDTHETRNITKRNQLSVNLISAMVTSLQVNRNCGLTNVAQINRSLGMTLGQNIRTSFTNHNTLNTTYASVGGNPVLGVRSAKATNTLTNFNRRALTGLTKHRNTNNDTHNVIIHRGSPSQSREANLGIYD